MPRTTKLFLKECTPGITEADLARFLIEEGFLEAVAREPAHWLQKAHLVMEAAYANAVDPTRPDQMKWCDYFFDRLKKMSEAVAPFKGKSVAHEPRPAVDFELIEDDAADEA